MSKMESHDAGAAAAGEFKVQKNRSIISTWAIFGLVNIPGPENK